MQVKVKDIQREGDNLIFFRSQSYRWEDNQSADPLIEDRAYHLTEEQAIEVADSLKHEVGYRPQVEKLIARVSDLDEDDEEVDLKELRLWDSEIVYDGCENDGKSITGAIVIRWSWERYPGYCRNLLEIGVCGEYPFDNFKSEAHLITGNEDSTYRDNFSILLTKEEVEACLVEGVEDLLSSIEDELNQGHWKWNHFRKNPNSKNIQEQIEERIEKHFKP